MALADRDYYGEPEPRGGSASRLTPVVKALLIANIAIFILDYLVLAPAAGYPPLSLFGAFKISTGIHELQIWQLITFQFLHAHFLHILFNSIGLFIFGPWMERHFGSAKFMIYYLISGAAGALFYTLMVKLNIIPAYIETDFGPYEVPLVGASAGIYGCLMGVAVLAPRLRVQLLFPPIVLTMRQLSMAILAIAVVYITFNLDNAGGEAGHLGGAIAGYIMMRFVPWLHRGPKTDIRAPKFGKRYESKLSPRSELHLSEDSEVDAILDKISKEGFQSLTDDERDTLKRAAQQDNE